MYRVTMRRQFTRGPKWREPRPRLTTGLCGVRRGPSCRRPDNADGRVPQEELRSIARYRRAAHWGCSSRAVECTQAATICGSTLRCEGQRQTDPVRTLCRFAQRYRSLPRAPKEVRPTQCETLSRFTSDHCRLTNGDAPVATEPDHLANGLAVMPGALGNGRHRQTLLLRFKPAASLGVRRSSPSPRSLRCRRALRRAASGPSRCPIARPSRSGRCNRRDGRCGTCGP